MLASPVRAAASLDLCNFQKNSWCRLFLLFRVVLLRAGDAALPHGITKKITARIAGFILPGMRSSV